MTRTGIKLDLDVGDLVSNAGRARGAIAALGDAMKKAESEDRWDDYGKLAYEKERMQGRATGFEKDIRAFANNPKFQTTGANGQPVFKVDQEYASLIKAQTKAMERLTAEYEAAIKGGDIAKAQGLSPQIEKQQNDFKKLVEQTGAGAGTGRNIQGAVQAIGIGQIANALNDGFSRWVSTLDRSGIVSQYGSGDVMGGRIAEKRRQANLWGGIAQTGLTALGTGIGFFLGGPGGAMLGGTLGSSAGRAINEAQHIPINREATHAAYASLWHQRSGDAMELAALMGNPGMAENGANMVRESFKIAAKAAEGFGYSAEEGMEAMKQAARQGLDAGSARGITEQIFQYERSTGADRGTMTSIATMSARYGGGDALRAGWAGLGASGMKPGQFNEYLQALKKTMQDAINTGFVRSAEQSARSLTMLARMTDNSPLWQGEMGARRLSEMNAGLQNATGLQSASDMVAFRAARNFVPEGSSYIDAMLKMEEGLTPEFFNEYMKLTSSIEGGDRAAMIERMRQTFGLNYTNANALHKGWVEKGELSRTEIDELTNRQPGIPTASSPELEGFQVVEKIKNEMTMAGQGYWDNQLPELYRELEKIRMEIAGTSEPLTVHDVAVDGTARVFGEGYASQIDRLLVNQEENATNTRIRNARVDPFWLTGARNRSRAERNAGSPLFSSGDADDMLAYGRLQGYMDEGNHPAFKAFEEVAAMLKSFTPEQRQTLNESNAINAAIPDVMTDRTGQHLLEAIRGLADQLADRLDITVNVNE